jgi:hypothetical protein
MNRRREAFWSAPALWRYSSWFLTIGVSGAESNPNPAFYLDEQ